MVVTLMGKEEGTHDREPVAADFEEVEERHAEVEFEEFSEEVELAFPEDTIAFDELFDESPSATTTSHEDDTSDGDEHERPERRESSEASSDDGGGSLTEQLVAEIAEGDASDQAVGNLREELGVTSPQNVQIRLRHLQTQVSDLTAYIDALEAFLDDRGSATQVLESVESELESIDARLDDLERAHNADHDQLHDRIATVEEGLETHTELSDDLTDARRRIETLESHLTATDETVDTTTERIDALEDDVSSALTTLGHRQAKLQEKLESIQQTHRKLAQALGSSSNE